MKKSETLLKGADILRFLAAKGWFRVCSSCGCRDFTPLDEHLIGARAGFPVLKRDGEKRSSDGLFEVVIIACANCGDASTHERRLVADWVAANPQS
jgi:hypothetical protein